MTTPTPQDTEPEFERKLNVDLKNEVDKEAEANGLIAANVDISAKQSNINN